MSLATRCPSCGTAFRVVQDQLKVSEGWVRCGNCQDVFNALESLFDLAPEARHKASVPVPLEQPDAMKASAASSAPPSPPPTAPDQPTTPHQDLTVPAVSAPDALAQQAPEEVAEVENFWAPVASARPVDEVIAEPDLPADHPMVAPADTPAGATEAHVPASEQLQQASDAPPTHSLLQTPSPAPFGQATPAWTGIRRRRGPARAPGGPAAPRPLASGETTQPSLFAPDSLLPAPGLTAQADPVKDAPDFVRQAERAARWQSPAWRTGLSMTASLLLLVLGLQVSVFQRDEWASRWPVLQPALSRLCQALACTLGAPRDIQHLVLDNSRLARTSQADVLQLVAELHNRSNTAVRKPALDVSFTDASGQQVARKVFLAQQLSGTQDRIEANAPWNVDIRLRTPSLAITGFTMEVFYP